MKNWYIAALALLGIVAATPSWAQCHVGVQTGYSMASTGLSAPVGPVTLGIDGLGAKSTRPDFGGHVGCDVRVLSSPVKVGVWGELQNSDTQFAIQPALLTMTLGNSWAIGGRVGYDMGGAMPYLLLGHKQVDVEYGGIATALPAFAAVGLPTKMTGWVWGAGIEAPIKGTSLSLAGEVRQTLYREESIVLGAANLKTEQLEGMVRLNWNFYGGEKSALLK